MSIFSNPASTSKEDAKAYTAAVLGLIEGRDPLDVLRTTPTALRAAVAAVDPSRLAAPEAPGKWSVREVLAHLADSELVYGWRLRMIIAHDRPAITGYDQDLWAERLHYSDVDPEVALATFETLRPGNLRLIDNASDAVLARVGVHSERGEESVAHLIRMYAGHDVLHLRQIDRILKTV